MEQMFSRIPRHAGGGAFPQQRPDPKLDERMGFATSQPKMQPPSSPFSGMSEYDPYIM